MTELVPLLLTAIASLSGAVVYLLKKLLEEKDKRFEDWKIIAGTVGALEKITKAITER